MLLKVTLYELRFSTRQYTMVQEYNRLSILKIMLLEFLKMYSMISLQSNTAVNHTSLARFSLYTHNMFSITTYYLYTYSTYYCWRTVALNVLPAPCCISNYG